MRRLERSGRMVPDLTQILLLFLYSIAITYQIEWVFRENAGDAFSFALQHPVQFWYETLFVFLVTLLIFAVVRRLSIAALLGGALFEALSIANYIKASTRSEPLLPWDFTVIKDASEIASRSRVIITFQIYLSCAFVALCFVLLVIFRKRFRTIRLRLAARAGIVAAIAGTIPILMGCVFMNSGFLTRHDITEITWNQIDNYKENGVVFSFLNNFSNRSVKVPADYSEQTVKKAESQITRLPSSSQKPNIIYIQDEAFCDLSEFRNVTFSQDIMSTIHSLQQTALSGYTLTPMFGGGTCNSEMEVLTGFSYSFLPNGSVPYQEYFKQPTFSYASYLRSIGYSTVAIHPFDPTFWDRNTVFPNIGFDKFVSQNDFVNPEKKRDFITDLEAMKKITEEYEANKSTGKPFFNMTITMQNHYSWGTDDYPADERVSLEASGLTDYEKGVLASYATGVRDADAALKYLIDYFSKVSDPTIIVFYGDHMPALDQNTLRAGGYITGDPDSPENVEKLHSTPYVIWNNYSNVRQSVNLSMYELTPYLTQSFNLSRPLYFDFLLDQFRLYRGYATGVYIGSDNQPTMQMPQGGQTYSDEQYLFEYDLLIGKQYGTELTQ